MKLTIATKSKNDENKELRKIAELIDRKKFSKIRTRNGVYFESLDAMLKVLTDKRLDVWRMIKNCKPSSVTHLAELLGRGFRSVHRDVLLLEELGLIKMSEGPGTRGNVQVLISLYDELQLAVA